MLQPAVRAAGSIVRSLVEFVYPPVCFVCERYLPDSSSNVCAACWATVQTVGRTDALYNEMRDRLRASGVIDDLASAFYFEKEGTLQALIHQLKYDEMTVIGVEFGKHVAVAMARLLEKIPDADVVPVPLHSVKQRERGYNQSYYIAQGVQIVTGLSVLPHLLRRAKNTPSQTHLNRDERWANVQDAFEIARGKMVRSSSYILIDDVITTGATIQACAHVLKEHGARRVYAASIALATYAADSVV